MTRIPIVLAFLLLCSPLLAEEAAGTHDPVAQWLNKHSHELMEGTLAIMLLVGDYDTVRDAAVTLDGMVTSLAGTEGLKLIVDEPRPNDASATDGFPSSHSAAAFAFARGLTDWRSEWVCPCTHSPPEWDGREWRKVTTPSSRLLRARPLGSGSRVSHSIATD